MLLSAPIQEPPLNPLAKLPVKFFASHAREFAHLLTLGVDTAPALGAYFGLTLDQTESLVTSSYFNSLLLEAQDELKNTNTVMERARAMARLASPEAVTTLIGLARNGEDMKVSKDAAETILNLAGLSTKVSASPVGLANHGIAINISFATEVKGIAQPMRDVIQMVPEQFPALQMQENAVDNAA